VDAPVGILTPTLRETLTREKPSLLAALRDPRRAVREVWEGTLGEVAGAWDQHAAEARAQGRRPVWIDESTLQAKVKEELLSGGDLMKAIEAISNWRRAWQEAIVTGLAPAREPGEPAERRPPGDQTFLAYLDEAKRLPTTDLAAQVEGEDPDRREAAAAELRIRGNLVADEAEGRRPALNPTVQTMFPPATPPTPIGWYRP
jgi:hypothetical protein